jgi:3D (Asp-Asp-Asp) domain-containing protein
MKNVQARHPYTKPYSLLSFSFVMIAITFCIVFLLSPLSPLHADTNAAPWNGNFVAYNVGDTVSYDGQTYTCIQSHTSEPNWNPVDAASLWQLTTSNVFSVPVPHIFTSANTNFGSGPDVTPTVLVATPTSPVSIPPVVQASSQTIPVSVTFYTDEGPMADGVQTHIGACAVFRNQFPLGTELALYDPANLSQPAYTCTAEDTGTAICQNDIDVALPGQVEEAIQLGRKPMLAQVVGFDQTVAQEAAANHPASMGCEG